MAMRYERLTTPLVREGGELRDASWDEALDHAATGFRAALDEGALTGVFSCSKATSELTFATQKFARVFRGGPMPVVAVRGADRERSVP